MKKYFGIVCLSVMLTLTSVIVVSAGYNLGPNNIFHMETAAGFNIFKGDWIEGTMSNGTAEARKYEKQVYARSGAGGTYSDWSTGTITHRDWGALNNGYSEVRGFWNYIG